MTLLQQEAVCVLWHRVLKFVIKIQRYYCLEYRGRAVRAHRLDRAENSTLRHGTTCL